MINYPTISELDLTIENGEWKTYVDIRQDITFIDLCRDTADEIKPSEDKTQEPEEDEDADYTPPLYFKLCNSIKRR